MCDPHPLPLGCIDQFTRYQITNLVDNKILWRKLGPTKFKWVPPKGTPKSKVKSDPVTITFH